MTLKIVARPKFEATVHVQTRHLKGSFNARFVALPSSQIKHIEDAAAAAGKGPEALLFEVVDWFETVELPDGPLHYVDRTSLDKLLDNQGIGPAMLKTYYRSLWEETEGN